MEYLLFSQAQGGCSSARSLGEEALPPLGAWVAGDAQQGYGTHSGNVKMIMRGKVVVLVRAKCLPGTGCGPQREGLIGRVPEGQGDLHGYGTHRRRVGNPAGQSKQLQVGNMVI